MKLIYKIALRSSFNRKDLPGGSPLGPKPSCSLFLQCFYYYLPTYESTEESIEASTMIWWEQPHTIWFLCGWCKHENTEDHGCVNTKTLKTKWIHVILNPTWCMVTFTAWIHYIPGIMLKPKMGSVCNHTVCFRTQFASRDDFMQSISCERLGTEQYTLNSFRFSQSWSQQNSM